MPLQVGDNLTVHDIDDDGVLLVDDSGNRYRLEGGEELRADQEYTVRLQQACYVYFYYRVNAENEKEAIELAEEGSADYLGCMVGDTISFVDGLEHKVVDELPTHGWHPNK